MAALAADHKRAVEEVQASMPEGLPVELVQQALARGAVEVQWKWDVLREVEIE